MQVESLEKRELLSAVAWSVGPALPAPRTDAVAVVTSDSAVRLLGGDSAAATNAPLLTPGATSWSLGANTDTVRNDLGAVSTGNSVYLFGGTSNDEGSDEVLNYDYRFGDSQDVAKMNTIRYDLGYATDSSGRAYALGGIGVFADGEIWADAERYDPTSDTWTSIASMPQALHGMSAVGDGNGHIFVFGGSTTLDDSGIQRTVYSYDVASDTWSTVAPMITGTRDSAIAVDDTGSIFITGGMTTTGATDAVQVYDPTTNSWAAETPLPEPLYSHAAAFDAGGHILVAGGFDATGTATSAVYQTQDLTITDIAPVITTNPVTGGSLDQFYTYDVNASGNPDPSYSLADSPAGMTIDLTNGLISWQPVAGQVGVHSVIVQASNRAGTVEQAFDISVVADTLAPTTPANFTFDSATVSSVTFSWDASSDAVGVDHYEIATANYTGPRFGKRWVYTVVDTLPGTSTSATITDLAPLEAHRYAVRAVDAAGNISSWSPRVTGTALAAPTISYSFGTQTSGTIQSPALTPIEIQLRSTANPAATFSLVTAPAAMTVNSTTGLVRWTPDVADTGLHNVTFRALNSEGNAEVTVAIDVLSDAPQLSVQFDPTTGSTAVAGTLFTSQVIDSSNTPPTYSLVSGPAGLTLDATTGAIAWTPIGEQGGPQSVTVRGISTGGTTDLTFNINTLFTAAVTGVTVSGTSLLEPTAHWVAPSGEGSDLVASYQVHGYAKWGVGRTSRTHTVDYTVPASETSVLMTGLVTGRSYRLTITPLDANGNPGAANNATTFVSSPALPQIRWTVNGFSGGSSVPGQVIAGQPAEVVLTDNQTEPSSVVLLTGPEGLTFDPSTNTAQWTPTAAQVTTGYTTSNATFRATNSVGSVDATVLIRVFFSGTVKGASATRINYNATASWDPPTDNATPVAAYKITRYWTFAGSHKASASYTVDGNQTSFAFVLGPTGAAVHKGITIAPIDEFGNLGVSTQRIAFGSYQNDLPPIATDDVLEATEDTLLSVGSLDGLLANDIDTDNTPYANPLTAQLVSSPVNGTLQLGTNGSVNYTPNTEFHGTDSFVYRVYDGRFYSDNATVMINVAAVNDAPVALDDHYFAASDTPLAINAGAGVLANDSDADGDVLTVAVVDNPANGTLTLEANGSFSYTPNTGFAGIDTFTYLASDALLGSRIATVSIEMELPATKFFVVDTDVESMFEYADDGTLVDSYRLHARNKGSQGVTTTSEGSTVYDVNGNRLVYVYDGDGGYLGRWKALDPRRVDGIATDDTDLWILDRKLDTVFHYAGAASQRTGELVATDSFKLHDNNRNGKGITTDGTNIWVVNSSGGKDKVYKYDIDGNYVGRWNIDPLNANPTGITIDPTGSNASIWIVDNNTDSVYQYNGGTTRRSGSAVADAVFELAPTNTNPQGIADPKIADRQTTQVATANQQQTTEIAEQPNAIGHAIWSGLHATHVSQGRVKQDLFVDSRSSDRTAKADTASILVFLQSQSDSSSHHDNSREDHLDAIMSQWSKYEALDDIVSVLASGSDPFEFESFSFED